MVAEQIFESPTKLCTPIAIKVEFMLQQQLQSLSLAVINMTFHHLHHLNFDEKYRSNLFKENYSSSMRRKFLLS